MSQILAETFEDKKGGKKGKKKDRKKGAEVGFDSRDMLPAGAVDRYFNVDFNLDLLLTSLSFTSLWYLSIYLSHIISIYIHNYVVIRSCMSRCHNCLTFCPMRPLHCFACVLYLHVSVPFPVSACLTSLSPSLPVLRLCPCPCLCLCQ